MNNNKIQLRNQAMSDAWSLYDVLTELGMKIDVSSKIEKWAIKMSFDGNVESGCNIALLASQLTHKIKKYFPHQYNVTFYTHLAKYMQQAIYDQMIEMALKNMEANKKEKNADKFNQVHVTHCKCSLDELKEGDIGIGLFIRESLIQDQKPVECVLDCWNQGTSGQNLYYMMIKKTKDGVYAYDSFQFYRVSNNQILTDEHYLYSGIAMIVSKEEN